MPCRSCGGNRSKTPSPTVVTSRTVPSARGAQKVVNMSQDENYVMVRLNDGNHGGHPIVGGATHTKYGYRSHGQSFLIHRDDFNAAPHNYILLENQARKAAVTVPKTPKPSETPAPPPIASAPAATPEPSEPPELREHKIDDSGALVSEPEEETLIAFDPQAIQGVTPAIAEAILARGITSYDQLAALSDDELRDIDGVGPARVRSIASWRTNYLRIKSAEEVAEEPFEELLDETTDEPPDDPASDLPDEDDSEEADSNDSFSGFPGA